MAEATLRRLRVAGDYAGLAVMLAASAALRFWGLSAGIPYAPGADEPVIMSHAVRMMQTGDLNPHFFDYPSLFFYIQLATACVRFIVGAIHGEWISLDQVGPEDFYLWGRAVTALLGTATTALVYLCGNYWSRTHGLAAAAVSVVFPLHVRESHYVLTDVPATFFVALALLLSLRASRSPSLTAFAAAGAAVGLATATKYNALVAVVLPILAAASGGRMRMAYAGTALASTIAIFLIGAPYTILDLPGFLNGFAKLASSYVVRTTTEPGWITYLKHLQLAMTPAGLLLLFFGFASILARGIRAGDAARHWLLVVFPLIYFAFVSRQGLVFARYLLPVMPFIALIMAVALVSIGDLTQRIGATHWQRNAVAMTVTILALWPQAMRAVGFDRLISRPSTQAVAYQWLVGNVKRGSSVVTEKYEIRLIERHYRVEGELRLINRTYEQYVSSGTDYLIATSYVFGPIVNSQTGDPANREAYERLFSQAREVFRTGPTDQRVGPEIRVYSIRNGLP